MTVYLHDIPLDLAKQKFRFALEQAGLWQTLGEDDLPLDEQLVGRVLSGPVWAVQSSPHYHASAMDGFALCAESTVGASPSAPVVLEVGSQAAYVDTGDPLPDWANAVVPIEQVESLTQEGGIAVDLRHPVRIRLRAALTPWAHVRPMGEDIIASQLVLPTGHVLKPADLGAIAASGHSHVTVSRLPRVAILPTGTELVPVGQPLKRGDIVDFNSIILAAQVKEWGGIPKRYPITPDSFDQICENVQQAVAESDLVLLNAGSSAGSEDFSAQVIEKLGQLLVHGIAMRPGHPVILGLIPRSSSGNTATVWVPIIGVPGYPVSAALTTEIFVRPLLDLWAGRPDHSTDVIDAQITRKIASPAGDDDYVRVVVGVVGDRTLAAPLSRGAGVITSLVRADGITIIPRGVQGLEAGAPVKVQLYRKVEDLHRTIFVIGSHDMTLDVLAQHLSAKGRRLVSANVGSLGGLVALRRKEAHVAGSHLLDPETGDYNLSSIRQYLPGIPVKLVVWVGREQGLIVKPGNPKNIQSLQDLARPDVRFTNRQRGAGTRVLLDYHLKNLGILPDSIRGYEQEEFTHLAVAAAVASNRADCALGVTAAAKALGLDFIPLFVERYDLVIPCEHARSGLLDPLFDLMKDASFQKEIASMPGYDVSQMGVVVMDGL